MIGGFPLSWNRLQLSMKCSKAILTRAILAIWLTTAAVSIATAQPTAYWDADANPANNNTSTGAGLGGSGAWDVGAKWYNGVTDTSYVADSDVVFTGASGVVTFTSPQSVNSLVFKTTGYTVSGTSLALTGPNITTDAGVISLINSPISGSTLTKAGSGTLSLSGTNSFSVLNINAGSVELHGGAAMSDVAAVNLANTAGANMAVAASETIGSLSGGGATGGNVILSAGLAVGGNNSSTTYAGSISGTGGFMKVGNGVLTFSGSHAFAGGTTIGGGTLEIDGSLTGSAVVQSGGMMAGIGTIGGTTTVFSGGHLSPGNSAGTISMNGLGMQLGSFLHADIGPSSDQVVVTTNLAVNGTLDVQLTSGFTPSVGQSFTLMTAAAVSGTFATESVPTFSFRTFDVIYNPQSVVLKVVPVLSGDYNTSGKVDGADYVVWRNGLGTIYTPADYDVWRAHFGETAGAGVSLSAVPEPATCVLLLGGAAVYLATFGRFSKRSRT